MKLFWIFVLLGCSTSLSAQTTDDKSTETSPPEPIKTEVAKPIIEQKLKEVVKKVEDSFEGVPPEVAANPLISAVSSSLDVNDYQASGGTGAMLAMAYQSLSAQQSATLLKTVPHINQLTAMIPGVYASNIANLASLSEVFSVLGLSPTMIQKYSKVIRDYLKKQGASAELLNALSTTWAY